ncbi:glycosyltransferase [Corynebacterium halotolerans]|uniref:Glycosyl transferase family protein n=1 Tax=Corynebacterium halotolerans YIM 70093 = DSM 44683 TaxID=1121362 RepID=M1MUG5_9CORY|nr:glycosyltransferase [Corynebacterium halotolerans]AGF71384.1 glycosyl transferase family protein [Corynebacterium halotolerans YIM 70093 = DSM 44683]
MTTLAALVTVYHRIVPEELSEALESLAAQTRPADEIVIVEDGPVGDRLRAVIDAFVDKRPEARTVVLARNQGSGPASAAGMATITSTFVARLDADDIAAADRFARQLDWFAAHPELDVLGTSVTELNNAAVRAGASLEEAAGKVRALPEHHDAITRYLRINSPVNHPSVMMRTAAVVEAGGYRDVHHMEDYDLWARLLAGGARFHNLSEPLTYFRVSPEQFARRTGKGMFAAERQMQRNLVSYGLISRPRAVVNLVVRTAYRLLPAGLLTHVYGRLFHR